MPRDRRLRVADGRQVDGCRHARRRRRCPGSRRGRRRAAARARAAHPPSKRDVAESGRVGRGWGRPGAPRGRPWDPPSRRAGPELGPRRSRVICSHRGDLGGRSPGDRPVGGPGLPWPLATAVPRHRVRCRCGRDRWPARERRQRAYHRVIHDSAHGPVACGQLAAPGGGWRARRCCSGGVGLAVPRVAGDALPWLPTRSSSAVGRGPRVPRRAGRAGRRAPRARSPRARPLLDGGDDRPRGTSTNAGSPTTKAAPLPARCHPDLAAHGPRESRLIGRPSPSRGCARGRRAARMAGRSARGRRARCLGHRRGSPRRPRALDPGAHLDEAAGRANLQALAARLVTICSTRRRSARAVRIRGGRSATSRIDPAAAIGPGARGRARRSRPRRSARSPAGGCRPRSAQLEEIPHEAPSARRSRARAR